MSITGQTFPAIDVRYRLLDRHITVPNVMVVDVYDARYVAFYPTCQPTGGEAASLMADEVWLEAWQTRSGTWTYCIEVGDGPRRAASKRRSSDGIPELVRRGLRRVRPAAALLPGPAQP